MQQGYSDRVHAIDLSWLQTVVIIFKNTEEPILGRYIYKGIRFIDEGFNKVDTIIGYSLDIA